MEHTEPFDLTQEEAEIIIKMRKLKKYGKEGLKSYNYLVDFIPRAVDSLIPMSISAEQQRKVIEFSARRAQE